jgi:hypothetical protein
MNNHSIRWPLDRIVDRICRWLFFLMTFTQAAVCVADVWYRESNICRILLRLATMLAMCIVCYNISSIFQPRRMPESRVHMDSTNHLKKTTTVYSTTAVVA